MTSLRAWCSSRRSFGYFVFAIPASLFMRRFGYRAAVVMGLGLFGTGALLFYPAAQPGEYHGSWSRCSWSPADSSFLETSANPMIAVMGPAGSADQRLNFAQTFNPIGTMIGVFVGKMLILSDIHFTPDQIQRDGRRDALAAWRAGRARRGQTTLPRHRLRGARLGAAGRLREIPADGARGSRRTTMQPPAASAASRNFRATGWACSRSSRMSARRSACGAS